MVDAMWDVWSTFSLPLLPVRVTSVGQRKREKRRNRKKGGRGTKVEAEREREKEKESEEEKEENGGGMKRGKWCSKKPTSTLDWNLKVPASIPGDHPPQNYTLVSQPV